MSENNSISFDVHGTEDLAEALGALAKEYPDAAGELLEQNAKELRKKVAKKAREMLHTNGTKRSLGRMGSYGASKAKNFGKNQYVEISAKSPHFHLLERGHELVDKKGNVKGYVQGYHFMEKATQEFEEEMPEMVEKMVDQLLKESGLS